MRNHAGRDEQLASLVVVDAPWVAEAVGNDFEPIFVGVVAPHASIDLRCLTVELHLIGKRFVGTINASASGRATHARWSRKSLAPVQPSVRAPDEAIQCFVAVTNAPASESYFDVIDVCPIVAVAIRYPQQIWRRSQPKSARTDRNRSGKGNAIEKHFASISPAVAVGVFQDQDATISVAGEARRPRFVVAIFGHPQTAAVVPAKRHGLGNHGLGREDARAKSVWQCHPRGRLIGCQKFCRLGFLLRQFPLGPSQVIPGELGPHACQPHIVEFARKGDDLVPNRHFFAFGNSPIARSRWDRSDAQLPVDAPCLRKAPIVRVVENGDVREIVPSFDLHSDIQPDGSPTFGALILLPRAGDRPPSYAWSKRHAKEQSTVVVFANDHIGKGLSCPNEIQHVVIPVVSNRPGLGLLQDRFAGFIQEVVHRLPLNLPVGSGLGRYHSHRDTPPMTAFGMVKVVPAIDARESPVQTGLMLVMSRAVLRELSLAVWRDHRVQVGAESPRERIA